MTNDAHKANVAAPSDPLLALARAIAQREVPAHPNALPLMPRHHNFARLIREYLKSCGMKLDFADAPPSELWPVPPFEASHAVICAAFNNLLSGDEKRKLQWALRDIFAHAAKHQKLQVFGPVPTLPQD